MNTILSLSMTGAIEDLKAELRRETDADERANIARTIAEIEANHPIELPTQTVVEWEKSLL